jgi:hypothetical protein
LPRKGCSGNFIELPLEQSSIRELSSLRVPEMKKAHTVVDLISRTRPERYAPSPSMDGARLRQRTLSKIVPYDFVEPRSRLAICEFSNSLQGWESTK